MKQPIYVSVNQTSFNIAAEIPLRRNLAKIRPTPQMK